MSSKPSRVHPPYKTKYRVLNWATCNKALVNSSATFAGPLPAPIATSPVSSARPTAAPCSWTMYPVSRTRTLRDSKLRDTFRGL